MELLQTPLYREHVRLNARMISFDGFEMPVLYSSIIDEHFAVRERVGLFDVSHMGEIELLGEDALSFSDYILTNSMHGMRDGDIRYSPMCYPEGGQVDDLFVHRINEERVLLVVNASPNHSEKDFNWIRDNSAGFNVQVVNRSPEYAQLALQGPTAAALIDPHFCSTVALADLNRFKFVEGRLLSRPILISRTGYTGEDGFEIYCEPGDIAILWNELLDLGQKYQILPCGLGARDTLRFEVCYWLYGNDISRDINPLEAGQGWAVKFEKDTFIGREALYRVKTEGLKRRLTGLHVAKGGIARNGMQVFKDGSVVGFVTSGNYAPSLKGVYAMALLEIEYTELDTGLVIDIRNHEAPAEVVTMPFFPPINHRPTLSN